ncbi:MAG: hypothetical protein F2923_00485 [Actinobacteria bacterium]|uniref:Unannotated protein n=1 Tax=freshwater metagenome TaxID=449393 RepID=A0A6J7FN52_9ZZZZ|nr:hypothetical protein [Actinomycetota bacterium]MTB27100.1 hypothetical protein [Actinomycetota bacterium]
MSVETRGISVSALPAFLRFLSTYPEPQEVCDVLMAGPLSSILAQSVNMVLKTTNDTFKTVAATGMAAPLVPRYQEFSCSLSTPVSHAVREAEIVSTRMLDQFDRYTDLEIDRSMWEEVSRVTGDLMIETVPIVSNGTVLGVYVVFHDPELVLSRADFSMLSGIGHLLGVWATHPLTETNLDASLPAFSDELAFMLNERQLQVLELVELGRSNSAIGVILGYSQSTVKQDLQRAMRVLRASDRIEAAQRARELGLQGTQNA